MRDYTIVLITFDFVFSLPFCCCSSIFNLALSFLIVTINFTLIIYIITGVLSIIMLLLYSKLLVCTPLLYTNANFSLLDYNSNCVWMELKILDVLYVKRI